MGCLAVGEIPKIGKDEHVFELGRWQICKGDREFTAGEDLKGLLTYLALTKIHIG